MDLADVVDVVAISTALAVTGFLPPSNPVVLRLLRAVSDWRYGRAWKRQEAWEHAHPWFPPQKP
jgi:uncharacterized membrane protein YbaN (DUF454 family)